MDIYEVTVGQIQEVCAREVDTLMRGLDREWSVSKFSPTDKQLMIFTSSRLKEGGLKTTI
jgi:hypothetical protein